MDEQTYSLAWSNHGAVVTRRYGEFFAGSSFCDVALSAGGQKVPCHRVVLAASSSYFAVSSGIQPRRRFSAESLLHRSRSTNVAYLGLGASQTSGGQELNCGHPRCDKRGAPMASSVPLLWRSVRSSGERQLLPPTGRVALHQLSLIHI